MSSRRIAVLAVALAMAGSAIARAQEAKRRVAVFPFEYATVREWVTDMWHSDVDIGKGVADMIVTDLVRNGTYSVVERSQLDRILGEQNFQQSGRADPSTAAQIGRLLGVDAIIIGSITEFGREDKRLGVGGNVRVGGIGIGRVGRNTSKAVVAINARIVSIQTAEILAVAEAKATSSRSGTSIAGDAAGVTNVDFGSSSFGGTIIGEATRETVNQLVPQLTAAASKIAETRVAVAGLVADVSGTEVILNIGTGAGVRVGGEYDVVRPGREVRDPASGRVIRRMTAPVGKVKITSADG
ncbi:MAG: CsgG/HfaB family protein, partial [Gemmatimonadales bacterium]